MAQGVAQAPQDSPTDAPTPSQAAVEGDEWCRGSGMIPTVYKVARALKREHNSLFNCLCSCIDDAAFVEEICCLYPGLPCFANLRCGRWYVRQPDDTCYFKSTDGHMGQWGFSLVRLNMHVALQAATHGGVVIVDATRNAHKGGFPDALAKTIPIWAAVLNSAVARVRAQRIQPPSHTLTPPCPAPQVADTHTHKADTQLETATPPQAQPSQQSSTPSSGPCEVSMDSGHSRLAASPPQAQPFQQLSSPADSAACSSICHESSTCQRTPPTNLATSQPSTCQQPSDVPGLPSCSACQHTHTKVPTSHHQASQQPHDTAQCTHRHTSDPCTSTAEGPPLSNTHGSSDDATHVAHSTQEDDVACNGGWDTHVHFPLWISRNEVQQVEARLHQWVDTLLSASLPAVMNLEQVLTKPLRPLWISQSSRIWIDQVAQPSDLPFQPLILVTASHARLRGERRPSPLTRQRAAAHAADTATAAANTATATENTASADRPSLDQTDINPQADMASGMHFYTYLPGAGDDEESWGGGLTPEILWTHQEALLESGPQGVYGVASELTRRHKSPAEAAALVSSNTAAKSSSAPMRLPAPTDSFHLAPQGCRDIAPAQVQPLGQGAFAIGRTGMVLGGWAAGRFPHVWSIADAVLYLGSSPHANAPCSTSPPCTHDNTTTHTTNHASNIAPIHSLTQPHSAEALSVGHASNSQGQTTNDYSNSSENGSGDSNGGEAGVGSGRYLHRPAGDDKYGPQSVECVLASAVPWVLGHLAAGRKVLMHDDTGVDVCVCVALAVHLAQRPELHPVTKEVVRSGLADIACHYPQARPTRNMLKQVYAWFHPRYRVV